MKTFAILAGLSVCAGSVHAAVFTSPGAFTAQVQPGAYFENFNAVAAGQSPALSFGPVNGFSFIVDSSPFPDDLFNGAGAISVNFATDQIAVTFTGAPVTAIGGNFWSTDINFNAIPATVTVQLSDGTFESFSSSAPTDFRGFTSLVPITSLIVDALDTGGNAWPTMDNLVVGQVIPAPGAMAIFGLAGVAAARRRR